MGPLEIQIRGHLTSQGIARTWQLALRFNMSTPAMRQRMVRLEKRGVVRRHPRYSAANDICWALAPPAEEL